MHTHLSCAVRAHALAGDLSRQFMQWALAAVLFVWATGAFAHAALIASVPAAGALLVEAPASLQLRFNEPVSPLQLRLIQPDGSVVPLEDAQPVNHGLDIKLPPSRQQGAHALSWRVVSADGHPVGGTVSFSVGVQGDSDAIPTSAVQSGRALLVWIARLAGYVALFFGIGLAACHVLLRPLDRQRRPLIGWLLALGAGATLMNVGVLGVDALDMPVSGLLGMAPWLAALSTTFGWTAGLMLAGLACAAICLHLAHPAGRQLLALAALVFVGLALSASGHASSAPPAWLARPAVWLHGLAVAIWLGSLLPLAWSLSRPHDPVPLQRFSRAIPTVLAALTLSGAVLIWLQVDEPSSLLGTGYGQVLLIKLLLVSALLALGAYNRFRLTKAAVRGESSARLAMRRVISVECVLALSILAVAALWRFTPPPRALGVEQPTLDVMSAHLHADSAMVDLALERQSMGGPATLTLYLSKPDLTPLLAQAVDVAFFNREAGIEPIRLTARAAPDGTWQVSDIFLPPQDRWQLRVDVLISDFERVRLETTLTPQL